MVVTTYPFFLVELHIHRLPGDPQPGWDPVVRDVRTTQADPPVVRDVRRTQADPPVVRDVRTPRGWSAACSADQLAEPRL